MKNIENIQQDIVWLSWLLYYRWDFFECDKHKDISTFFACNKNKTEEDRYNYYYRPARFSLSNPTLDVVYKEDDSIYAKLKNRQGVPVYINEQDIFDAKSTEKYTYITLTDEPFELITIKGEWAKVKGRKYVLAKETENVWVPVGNYLDFWLAVAHTNIPSNYHMDFTWDDYTLLSKSWSEEQKKLITANLKRKDRVNYWNKFYTEQDIKKATPPVLDLENSPYAHFIEEYQLGMQDRALLILTLVNQVRPDFLLPLIQRSKNYPDLGGTSGQNFKGFLPTGETYLFLMAGRDTYKRQEMIEFLAKDSVLMKEGWVSLLNALPGEPFLSGVLGFHPEQVPVLLDLQHTFEPQLSR